MWIEVTPRELEKLLDAADRVADEYAEETWSQTLTQEATELRELIARLEHHCQHTEPADVQRKQA